ncbi:unnamed protein product [Pylaiella littoralis]
MSSLVQQPSRAITAEEAGLVEQLRIRFPPGTTESYGMPLDDAVLVRYLRARDGSVEKSAEMLTATLKWRREFGLPEMLSSEMDTIKKENSTGKMYASGFDKQGQPVVVMRPRNENTMDMDGNIKHLVYQMERVRAILQRTSGGLGKACVVIDYVGFSIRNSPPKTSISILNILQNHYPETLGQAYFVSPPFIFKGFFKVIYPFIDKDTKERFCFVSGKADSAAAQAVLLKNFDADELEEAFGGKFTTEFDSAVYLAAPMDQEFRSALAASSSTSSSSSSSGEQQPPKGIDTRAP